MKYSEKKITKAVTEIYERVLSPQEIKDIENELDKMLNELRENVK